MNTDQRCDPGARAHDSARSGVRERVRAALVRTQCVTPPSLPSLPTVKNSSTHLDQPTSRNVRALLATLAGWIKTITDPHRDCRRQVDQFAEFVVTERDHRRRQLRDLAIWISEHDETFPDPMALGVAVRAELRGFERDLSPSGPPHDPSPVPSSAHPSAVTK